MSLIHYHMGVAQCVYGKMCVHETLSHFKTQCNDETYKQTMELVHVTIGPSSMTLIPYTNETKSSRLSLFCPP